MPSTLMTSSPAEAPDPRTHLHVFVSESRLRLASDRRQYFKSYETLSHVYPISRSNIVCVDSYRTRSTAWPQKLQARSRCSKQRSRSRCVDQSVAWVSDTSVRRNGEEIHGRNNWKKVHNNYLTKKALYNAGDLMLGETEDRLNKD